MNENYYRVNSFSKDDISFFEKEWEKAERGDKDALWFLYKTWCNTTAANFIRKNFHEKFIAEGWET